MPMPYAPGSPVLQVLDAGGNATLSVFLPPPDAGQSRLSWVKKAIRKELLNGSERMRILGYLPVLTLKWTVYPEPDGWGLLPGRADGNMATLQDLMVLLATPPERLRILPGPAVPPVGFRAMVTKDPSQTLLGAGFGKDVEVEFTGIDCHPTPALLVASAPPSPVFAISAPSFPIPHW